MATVTRREGVGAQVERDQAADPDRQMTDNAEIANGSRRNLPDAIGQPMFDVGELAVFDYLAAAEQSPGGMLERAFERERIVVVAFGALAAPGERPGEFPARGDLVGIEHA